MDPPGGTGGAERVGSVELSDTSPRTPPASSSAEAGADVVDRPFFASGNVATAGGCLSAQYLAAWIITRLADADTARRALQYVAPVGEKDEYVERAMGHVLPFADAVRGMTIRSGVHDDIPDLSRIPRGASCFGRRQWRCY